MSKECLNSSGMSKAEEKVTEFFNTAEAVQVEEGTWYYHESSVESELKSVYEQLAKANERVKELEEKVEGFKLRISKQKEIIGRYAKEGIEIAKDQEQFCIDRVVDAFEKAKIPRLAKAGCIGEFKFTIENANCCPECYHQKSDDCELCEGDTDENGLADLTATVPWDLCKEIWLRMNKIYAEQLRKKQA
jgi:hypothetical protein